MIGGAEFYLSHKIKSDLVEITKSESVLYRNDYRILLADILSSVAAKHK